MVTLRRVVTKTKSFKAVANQETRMKLLEVFINQILEVNQRKATQDEVPMNFKEVIEVAKDKLENVSDYFRSESGAADVSSPGFPSLDKPQFCPIFASESEVAKSSRYSLFQAIPHEICTSRYKNNVHKIIS